MYISFPVLVHATNLSQAALIIGLVPGCCIVAVFGSYLRHELTFDIRVVALAIIAVKLFLVLSVGAVL